MSTNQPIVPIPQCKAPFFFGVDVGGTGIKVGLVDDDGRTLAFGAIETEEPKGPADAMNRTAGLMKKLAESLGLKTSDFARVGLGTPGSQDIGKGMLIQPPNHPHWWNFPIVSCLEELIGLPVSFANDANAAAFGEFWVGTGQKYSSLALLTLGTGVGGGIIVDNHLIVGENSFGAECGHIIIDSSPNARLCTWGGGRGHLEAYASASGLVAIALERVALNPSSNLAAYGPKLKAKNIYEAAQAGDSLALQLIDETADYLAIGITNIVHIVDPGLVVLGGAMTFGGHKSPVGIRFLTKIREGFLARAYDHVGKGTVIDFALLGGDAGYLGAAGIARFAHHRQKI